MKRAVTSDLSAKPFKDYLYYLIPFTVLGGIFIYLNCKNTYYASGYYLIHYLYTYKHGFVARGLVGEVLSWFFETIDDNITKNVLLVFTALLITSVSLCIGKALNKVKDDKERFHYVLFLIVILCIMPSTFRVYYADIKLDKMLWALTFFAVFVADRKYAIWLAPILCVTATLINPVFLFCSMILIAIILLQEFRSSGYSIKHGLICGISYISMIALGLYGAISEKMLGFETPRELVDFYLSRYSGSDEINYGAFETEWLFDYFEPLKKVIQMAFEIYFKKWGNGQYFIINFVIVSLPIFILLSVIWINAIKNESNKIQRFIYFLCLISPIILVAPISISWEASKYFSNNIIVQMCLLIYFIVRKDENVILAIRKFLDFCKRHLLVSLLLILYSAITLL